MHSTRQRSSTRTGAVAALGALLASTALVATAPAAHAADKVVSSTVIDLSETRATGHNDFVDEGVHVYTEGSTSTDKAAGYFDVNKALSDVGEPKLLWQARNNNGGTNFKPSVQLKTDFDGDGTIDGILVGEPDYADGTNLYGDNWWLSNGSKQFVKDDAPSHAGGFGSANNGTLDQWRSEFPDAQVVQGGWSLGSGVKGDGLIYSITIGDEYLFEKGAAVTTKLLYPTDVDTSSTREKGHNEFRPTTGVRTYTDEIVPGYPGDEGHYEGYVNKAAGLFPVDAALADVGEPSIDLVKRSGAIPPGLWLNIDADGDGDFDGTLISESAYYGKDWWLNQTDGIMVDNAPSHEGGSGSENHGLLSEWRAKFPNARILASGWSLGGGVTGDYLITGITVGTTKYTFTGKNRAPSAVDASLTTKAGALGAGTAKTITLASTDPDGDELSYDVTAPAASKGTVDVDGDELTFTPAAGFAGKLDLPFTVSDGRGGSDTGTVSVTVSKLGSFIAISGVGPAVKTTKTSIVATFVVKIDGQDAPVGTKVNVYNLGKLQGSPTLTKKGVLVYTFPKKFAAGVNRITAWVPTSATVTSSTTNPAARFNVR